MVVLGEVGRNFAAGMTGGRAYVWDAAMGLKGRVAETAPAARRLDEADFEEVRVLIEAHVRNTGSPTGQAALQALGEMWVVDPDSSYLVSSASINLGST